MKIKLFALLIVFLLVLPVEKISADFTVTVENNGSGATSNASVTDNQTAEVSQSNQSEITNEVEVSANTGGNEASDNNGEVNISTGDVSQLVQVENTTNTNVVSMSQGGQDYDTNISGNGTDSQNTININQAGQQNVNQTNTATITNKINTSANTGNNTANNNQGDVSIKTGDIEVEITTITTSNLNRLKLGLGGNSYTAKVAGNGSNSTNEVIINDEYTQALYQANEASVENLISANNNTGKNNASDNLGEVSINTGDVVVTIASYTAVNENSIEAGDVEACNDDNPDQPGEDDDDDNDNDDTTVVPPVNPPSVGGSSGNGSDNDDDSDNHGGDKVTNNSDILPVTGSLTALLLLIGNFLMLLLGCYLRLRSGRSPAYAFA